MDMKVRDLYRQAGLPGLYKRAGSVSMQTSYPIYRRTQVSLSLTIEALIGYLSGILKSKQKGVILD